MNDYQPYDPYKSNYQQLRLHPHKILLALTLVGATMLFLGIVASYVYQRVTMGIEPVALPSIFLFNTLFLVASSWTLHRAKKAYLADRTEHYKRELSLTLLLTLFFMAAQTYGWYAMQASGLMPSTGAGAGYIYAIALLHFFHVFAGLPFFVLFLHTAVVRMKEPLSVLIYFSDPEKRLKLRLLEVYWHFLDVLWVGLVLFFTFNQLI